MPIMDGCTFRTQQLQDPKLAGIPMIAMSVTVSLVGRSPDVAFTPVVTPPVSLDALRRYCRGLTSRVLRDGPLFNSVISQAKVFIDQVEVQRSTGLNLEEQHEPTIDCARGWYGAA